MSLNAWEQQALDSIKDGLTGSDPELAALLSAFTQLASDEEVPDREEIRPGSRPALWRLRRARWRLSMRRVARRLGLQRAAVLLWLLAATAVIAVALALGAGGGHGTCTETAALICVSPAPGHSPGSSTHGTATGQPPVRTRQPGPTVLPG